MAAKKRRKRVGKKRKTTAKKRKAPKKKGHVPLTVLRKRLAKLTKIVKARS